MYVLYLLAEVHCMVLICRSYRHDPQLRDSIILDVSQVSLADGRQIVDFTVGVRLSTENKIPVV